MNDAGWVAGRARPSVHPSFTPSSRLRRECAEHAGSVGGVRILVTNDDGVDSPGILPFAAALADDGHDVFVVAPTGDRSGSGAALGQVLGRQATRRSPVTNGRAGPTSRCTPSTRHPATAVLAACLGGFGDLPDLVASGINPGANTGHLVRALGHRRRRAHRRGSRHSRPGGAAWRGASRASTTGTPRRTFAVAAVDWVAKPDGGPRAAQHQRARTCRSTRSRVSRRPSWRRTARCGSRRPTCPRATSSSSSRAAPTRRPAPTSACCRPATCR